MAPYLQWLFLKALVETLEIIHLMFENLIPCERSSSKYLKINLNTCSGIVREETHNVKTKNWASINKHCYLFKKLYLEYTSWHLRMLSLIPNTLIWLTYRLSSAKDTQRRRPCRQNVQCLHACVAFRRCWIYRTNWSRKCRGWLQSLKETWRQHICVRCAQMNASLLPAPYLDIQCTSASY